MKIPPSRKRAAASIVPTLPAAPAVPSECVSRSLSPRSPRATLPAHGQFFRQITPCPPSAVGSVRRKASVRRSVSAAKKGKALPSGGWSALLPIGTAPTPKRISCPVPKKRAKKWRWSAPVPPDLPARANWQEWAIPSPFLRRCTPPEVCLPMVFRRFACRKAS